MNRASKEKLSPCGNFSADMLQDPNASFLYSILTLRVFIQDKEPIRKQYYRRNLGMKTYGVASLFWPTKIIFISLFFFTNIPVLGAHTHSSYKFVYFLLDWQAHRSMGCQISPNILLTILFIAYLKYFTQARPKC